MGTTYTETTGFVASRNNSVRNAMRTDSAGRELFLSVFIGWCAVDHRLQILAEVLVFESQ